MNRLTLCFPYYLNAGMLARQYLEMSLWPAALKAWVEVIVVDDGSPREPAADVPRPAGLPALKILRMLQDVRWCQDACRNLAAAQARHPWLVLTDIDHIVPEATLARLVAGPLKRGKVYTFARVSAPGLSPYKPHPNSWCMTRDTFDAAGGYDERFCGYYGTDAMFRDSLRAHASGFVHLPEVLIRVPREVIPDASTTTYGRKEPQDIEAIPRIKAKIARMSPAEQRPARRGFKWERVL